jgi:RNA polymerase sigma factor (sigma-70 family)
MHDDAALLRSYVAEQSQDAFAELVQRHLPLVYSVALRRVGGDAHLAQDVAQKVFVDFARHASSLREHASLSGWLYVSAQLASADLVRREQRRKHRETAAYTMNLENASPGSDADLANLRPLLEDAIVTLKGDEREAIVLRYFEKRTFGEIGTVLRVTEEAARKRVDRALEKLHAILERRGITSTTVALGLALSATATGNIPVGLAAQISSAALSQATAATTSVLSTITAAVVPTAAVVAVCTWLILPQHRANEATAAEIAQLSAQVQSLPAVQAENDELSRSLAAARDLERAEVEQAKVRSALASVPPTTPKPTSNSLNLTSDGVIVWEDKHVTLDTFLDNLKSLHASAPGGESKLMINAKNVRTVQLFYVIDEARKAGIKHIVVDSDAAPEPRAPWSWF